jgi:hypothetical protein
MSKRTAAEAEPADEVAVNRSVVPSPERLPQGDEPELLDEPATPAGAELPTAGHHHAHDVGPVNTPAGAHVHAPGDTPHNHTPPAPVVTPPVVTPRPVGEDAEERKAASEAAATVTVDSDCKVVVGGQLVTLARGQKVTGDLARYLTDTGAPVSAVRRSGTSS